VSTLTETSGLASCRGESTALTVLVYRVTDPVNAGVITDLGVGRIDKDDLVVLHGSILVNPVRVKNAKVGKLASYLLLSNRLKVSLELKVVDTLMLGLTEDHTTVILTLASSTTDSDAYNYVTLLSLVTKTVSLLGTGGLAATDHLGALTVLPRANTKKETKGVTLLVTPKLFHVLVCSHIDELASAKRKM